MPMITYPDGNAAEMFDRVVDDEGLPGLILGIPENMDFLASSGADVVHTQSGAALLMRENGELKWRPFPGNSLTLEARSQDSDRERAEWMSVWGLRQPIMPPPFDFYCSMDPIKVGDILFHAPEVRGTVVAVFSQKAFAANLRAADWQSYDHGFLVESEKGGLYLYTDADEDIVLIQRADFDVAERGGFDSGTFNILPNSV